MFKVQILSFSLLKKWCWIFLSSILLLSEPINASEKSITVEPSQLELGDNVPRGIFVSSGPTVSDKVLSQQLVTGNLIRVGWGEVEPVAGKYDFNKIKLLVQQAKRLDKKVTLSVLNGPRAPTWLCDKGGKSFQFEFKNHFSNKGDREATIPLPWDSVYLHYWTAMVKALGVEFNNDKTIALVHITHSSKNGFEMQLPELRKMRKPETPWDGPWKKAGYTESRYIEALEQVVDAFFNAFPAHFLDIEIHPVLGSLGPARSIWYYGHQKIGQRFGLFSAWWSGKEQAWNRDMLPLIKDACQNSFCTFQIIGNETRQSDRLLDGSLIKTMQVAHEKGGQYFEVWDIDLKNQALTNSLQQFEKN